MPSGALAPARPVRRAILLMAAGGVALGLAARLADELAPKWVGNLGAIWFIAGFLAGRLASTPRWGARAGALCLAGATVTYYALRLAIDPISIADLAPVPMWWLVVGTGIGLGSGWLGAMSLRFPHAWGAPAGVLLGEALAVLVIRQRLLQVVIEVSGAGLCLRLTGSKWKRGLVLATASMPYVAGFAVVYRVALW